MILERLSDERFIWREDGSATRELFEEKYRKETGKSLKAVATLNDVEAIKQCVAAGLGISVVSAAALDEGDSASGRLKTFEVSDEFTREFYMIYRKSGVLSPAAETTGQTGRIHMSEIVRKVNLVLALLMLIVLILLLAKLILTLIRESKSRRFHRSR